MDEPTLGCAPKSRSAEATRLFFIRSSLRCKLGKEANLPEPLDHTAGAPDDGRIPTDGSFVTTTRMLEALADRSNHAAWEAFVQRYRPVVVGYARKLGVSAADHEDVAQQVLAEFARGLAAGSYQRGKGRLRAWLFGIARNQVRLWRRQHAARHSSLPEQGVESDDAIAEALWEREWQDHILRRSMEALKAVVTPQTLEAFAMFAIEGVPAEVVAQQLGMTPNAVFGAKRRVLEKLREFGEQIQQDE